jgi:hypothetical protein
MEASLSNERLKEWDVKKTLDRYVRDAEKCLWKLGGALSVPPSPGARAKGRAALRVAGSPAAECTVQEADGNRSPSEKLAAVRLMSLK